MSDGCSLRLLTLGLIPTMASYSSTSASSRSCFGRWCSFTLKALNAERMCEKSHARVKSKTLRPGLLESCEGFRMLDNHSANVKAETVCAQMIFGYKGKDLNTSSSPRVQHIPTSFQFGLNQLLQMLCWRR